MNVCMRYDTCVVFDASQITYLCSCTETVVKLKVVKDMSQLFVSPLTLQGFSSESELKMHLKQFRG